MSSLTGATMESIKKKMQALVMGKNSAIERAELGVTRYDELEEKLIIEEDRNASTHKRIQQLDNDLDHVHENLGEVKVKLNDAEKRVSEAELERASLQRRILLLEEDSARATERLENTTDRLEEVSVLADDSEKSRKEMESQSHQDDEQITEAESQLSEAQLIAEDADRKYDEVARKVPILEAELERSEDELDDSGSKIIHLEDELKSIGNNMKQLESFEMEAIQREESYEQQILCVTRKLKDAEERADLGERTMMKLQTEADRLAQELVFETKRYEAIDMDMVETLDELSKF